MNKLSRFWQIAIPVALLLGAILRLSFVQDMEYKEDEEYNFTQTTLTHTQGWPSVGIASGVYLVNPAMSVWVFIALAKLTRSQTPTELAHALQLFSLLGIFLIIPFALYFVKEEPERELWLWSYLIAMVNPFQILYERKLWPEPFLPFFCMLMLMGFWRRKNIAWAFVWGLVGAVLGQIHMSGFFMAFALFAWTVLFKRNGTHFRGWFAGSVVGSLPLIPWLSYTLSHPTHEKMVAGLSEFFQFKYWVFWVTDPLGLHLGNPLGLLRGGSNLDQIADFVRYPLFQGHPTFVVGIAHLTLFLTAVLVLVGFVRARWKLRAKLDWRGLRSETAFAQNAAFLGCGIVLSVTTVVIRRYYMVTTFPFEMIWLVGLCFGLGSRRKAIISLSTIVACELVISAGFVHYIHTNHGSIMGDYGQSYARVIEARQTPKLSP